jgi:Domain of unknown function (DUF5655)
VTGRWLCPNCEREFARPRQAHVCLPAGTVDETFGNHPPAWREVYDAIAGHLAGLGPVHADAVKVGVFLKSDRKLAEVRPRKRAVDLVLVMPHPVAHPRVSRTLRMTAESTAVFVPLTAPSEVDCQVCEWLTEAYDAATD